MKKYILKLLVACSFVGLFVAAQVFTQQVLLIGPENTEVLSVTDSTNADSIGFYVGSGTPESVVTAQLGSIYFDHAGGEAYLKDSGDGTNTGWSQIGTTAGGDVTGPASSTDNAITRFDLTTGKLIQNSGITISDANAIAGATIDGDDNTLQDIALAATKLVAGTNITLATDTLNVDDAFLLNTGDVGTGVFDFGGAASFEVPQSDTPTVDATGEIALDTDITDHTDLLIYRGGDAAEDKLIIAIPRDQLTTTDGDVIAYNATNNEFEMSLAGDVTGPGSATDNAITRFDLTTGKLIQNSGITISDANAIAGATIDGDDNTLQDIALAATKLVAGTNITLATDTLNVDDAFLFNTGDVGTGVFDFGGATSFEVPQSDTPTVDATGELALDTDLTDHTDLLIYRGGDAAEDKLIIAIPRDQLTTTDGDVIAYNAANNEFEMASGTVLRGYIDGLITANGTDADHDIDITTGIASVTDGSTYSYAELTSTVVGQIDAAWSVGTAAGKLDGTESVAGTPDASAWYHVWLIYRSDTDVTDWAFSENATGGPEIDATPIPTAYDYYRRVGAVLTDGSANIIGYTQSGDEFLWDGVVLDVSTTNPGTSAVTATLSTPLGVAVLARITGVIRNNGTGAEPAVLISALAQTDTAPVAGGVSTAWAEKENNDRAAGSFQVPILTNTSSAIRYRLSASDASTTMVIVTAGWDDRRGQN